MLTGNVAAEVLFRAGAEVVVVHIRVRACSQEPIPIAENMERLRKRRSPAVVARLEDGAVTRLAFRPLGRTTASGTACSPAAEPHRPEPPTTCRFQKCSLARRRSERKTKKADREPQQRRPASSRGTHRVDFSTRHRGTPRSAAVACLQTANRASAEFARWALQDRREGSNHDEEFLRPAVEHVGREGPLGPGRRRGRLAQSPCPAEPLDGGRRVEPVTACRGTRSTVERPGVAPLKNHGKTRRSGAEQGFVDDARTANPRTSFGRSITVKGQEDAPRSRGQP